MPVVSERLSLVKALSSVVLSTRRRTARRFLQGLSTEELRYIAGYLGACLLESAHHSEPAPRDQVAWDIIQYECCTTGCGGCRSDDVEHKMILLLEYLTSCQCGTAVMKIPAGSA